MNIAFTQKGNPFAVRLADDSSIEAIDNRTIDLPRKLIFEITYPTNTTVEKSIEREQWTIQDILKLFQSFFAHIYEEEEEEDGTEGGVIELECFKCKSPLLELYEHKFRFERGNRENCCICMTSRMSSKMVLSCGHKFHFVCLKKWFKNSNKCPLCNAPIEKCSQCNSERIIRISFMENTLRLMQGEVRLPTNGPHGIGPVYFEELLFDHIQIRNDRVQLITSDSLPLP